MVKWPWPGVTPVGLNWRAGWISRKVQMTAWRLNHPQQDQTVAQAAVVAN